MAYEPIWAIGIGKTAEPEQTNATHVFIRPILQAQYGEPADRIWIQYGGSVTPENITGLMAESEIDGALVGNASLQAAAFAAVVQYKAHEKQP